MPDHNTSRHNRGKKATGTEDWVKVPRDLEWKEDLVEESTNSLPSQSAATSETELKSTSVGSLLKEFCLKVVNTSSSGGRLEYIRHIPPPRGRPAPIACVSRDFQSAIEKVLFDTACVICPPRDISPWLYGPADFLDMVRGHRRIDVKKIFLTVGPEDDLGYDIDTWWGYVCSGARFYLRLLSEWAVATPQPSQLTLVVSWYPSPLYGDALPSEPPLDWPAVPAFCTLSFNPFGRDCVGPPSFLPRLCRNMPSVTELVTSDHEGRP
ncbi:hypothetical protein VPNG_02221 [Cytospora leucostoma]|uniref:Uncharacterized protein n=1 Tax=Cytospora leucostoma TaxID=1230097 RepID=A0A423XGP7_9PEZI|nr:hypothetical protein VPNG_02221 [Cytospora leucostoma]